MQTLQTIEAIRAWVSANKKKQLSIALVPTMGNLHQGHLALIKRAKQHADLVVATIFVNPLQFGEGEDFEDYPRTLAADQQQLSLACCDLLFAPSAAEMYNNSNHLTTVSVSGITDILCGASRPGHFDGVATVVTKLFNIVQPDVAIFGEKDWQQLAVIRKFVHDLNLPLTIIGAPIERAETGLALSSRNGYLSEQQRQTAALIYSQLCSAKQCLEQGQPLNQVLSAIRLALSSAGFKIDYVQAFSDQLSEVTEFDQDIRLFVAAKIGNTRLIDNLAVPFDSGFL